MVRPGAARVCREGGALVTTNVMVREAMHARLEVVADGLPMFRGFQLAIDTTLVSSLHCDGSSREAPTSMAQLPARQSSPRRAGG